MNTVHHLSPVRNRKAETLAVDANTFGIQPPQTPPATIAGFVTVCEPMKVCDPPELLANTAEFDGLLPADYKSKIESLQKELAEAKAVEVERLKRLRTEIRDLYGIIPDAGRVIMKTAVGRVEAAIAEASK
jgi:hypothetical protein